MLIALAGRAPRFFRPLVEAGGRALLRFSPTQEREPHWLARALIQSTDARIPVPLQVANNFTLTVPWGHDICAELHESGDHEPETRFVFEALLRPGQIVMDIGAHVGVFTLVGARAIGTTGHVHSFEPDPRTACWLRANVDRNQLTNVTVNVVAVSDNTGMATFHVGSDAAVSSLRIPRIDLYRSRPIRVSLITLANYVVEHRIPCIDVIKIDVEGGELAALRSIDDILKSPSRPTLIVEFAPERQVAFGSSVSTLATYLRESGYQLFRIGRVPLQPLDEVAEEVGIYNVLAISPEKASVFLASLSAKA